MSVAPQGPVVPQVAGWVQQPGVGRVVLRRVGATIAVAAHRVERPPLDPRAVAARLATGLRARTPGAAVEFRSRGSLAGRDVAMQVVAAGDDVQLHAVSGSGTDDDPLLVIVAVCTRGQVDEVGPVFAQVVAEVRGR